MRGFQRYILISQLIILKEREDAFYLDIKQYYLA